MTKQIVFFAPDAAGASLLKAHVDQFTRQDGTVVQAHDTSVQAAQPKPAAYDHPNVVGHAEKLQGGDASKAHGMHFAGKEYSASGKQGTSNHDGAPVRHFREVTGSGSDDGQHVWMDHQSRVHADGKTEVPKLRQQYEAHAAKSKPAGKLKPKAGDLAAAKAKDEAQANKDPKVAAGWERDTEDPVAVHVPPKGAKVRGQGIDGHGTVHSVSGNMVTVSHRDSRGGAQLTDHHASKLYPHDPGSVSGAAATHDSMADKHTAASSRAARAGDAKGELAHDAAAGAHDKAQKAHLSGSPNAKQLTEAALAASNAAEKHYPLAKPK